jgi:hypothetical protein
LLPAFIARSAGPGYSFEKHTATSMASTNSNDNSARNSVVLSIINPTNGGEMIDRPFSSNPTPLSRHSTSRSLGVEEELDIPTTTPRPYNSPAFDDVEKDFKDQLLSFTMDLLLSDFDTLKNIAERGNKILLHSSQLKKLIAILYLSKEDRPKWESLIAIDTEKIITTNCVCKSCANPFYEKIKNIYVNNNVSFLSTPTAVNMTSTFKISLEYCLTEEIKIFN